MKKSIRTLLVLALALALTVGLGSVAEAKNATRLTMSRRTLTMDWGTEYTLSVTTSPTSASDRKLITWAKSDDPAGLIESITPSVTDPRKAKIVVRDALPGETVYPSGTVTVTAMTPSGKKASCVIRIAKVNVSKIDVTPSSKTVYFTEAAPYAQYQMADPKFTPAVAGDQTSYEWSSNNESVATVDADGLVTFKAEGKVKIYATYTASAKRIADYCYFTVKPARVKSVSIKKDGSPASVTYVDEGEAFTLTAALTSAVSGVRPSYEAVTWQSSDPSVIELGASSGFDCDFTCKGSGIATITATADIGKYKKTATCTVYVRDAHPTTLTITAAGDCVLGGDPRTSGITARSTQRAYEKLVSLSGNPQYPFAKVPALFAGQGGSGYPNLSIVNVETCLTTKGGSNPSTDRKFLFRGNPNNAQALAVGIDIGNISNNHTSDFGVASFNNTASSIRDRSSDVTVPSGYNRYSGALYLPVKEVGGKRIGFYGVQANQVPASVLASRIKKYKRDYKLDMMVVTIHWTGQKEYVRPVSSTMKSYARSAINAGADLVIGHHRHEISGIEKYKGKYILYDLGNFVTGGGGGQWTYAVQIDFKISSSFTETASEGGVDQIRIYPVCTTSDARYAWNSKTQKYSTKQSNNWQPAPAEEAIAYVDKDTGLPVLDTTITAEVIRIINQYSPTGADGSRFTADSYIRSYSTLP